MPSIPIQKAWKLTGGTGRIEGVVRDADTGQPIGGATVLIRSARSRLMARDIEDRGWRPFFVTGPDGTFHLDGIQEGRFEVETHSPSHLSHSHSWLREFHGTGERGASLFDLFGRSPWGPDEALIEKFGDHEVVRNHFPRVTGDGVVRISLGLRPGQRIAGRVVAESGAPIRGASVEAVRQWVKSPRGGFDSSFRPVTTDESGSFAFAVYPDPKLEVQVTASGFCLLRRTIDPRSAAPIEFRMTPGRGLRGTVVAADGRPASRTRVLAFLPTQLECATHTDADGDGSWTLKETPAPPFMIFAWHGYAGGVLAEVRERASEPRLTLGPLATARARVVEPNGAPVADEIVSQSFLIDWQGRQIRINHTVHWDIGELARTDADGRFQLAVLPDPEGRAWIRYDYDSEPVRIDLREEATLVLSEEGAKQRGLQRQYQAATGQPASSGCTVTEATKAPKPKADLSPEKIEERNRKWIEFLKTAPPEERVELLAELREAACGNPIPEPPWMSDRTDLVPVFEAGVENDDGNTRFWAISCIHYMRRPDAFPFLVKCLSHADPHIRGYAATSIASLASHVDFKERAIAELKEALRRERQSWDTAIGIACHLAELGVAINPQRFVDAIKDDRIDHRGPAEGLGILKCREGIELILKRFEKADTWNSWHYSGALKAITGQDLGRDPAPWRAWFEANRAALPDQWT